MRPVSFLTLYGLDKDDIDKLDRFLLLLENLTVGEWINERKERNRLGRNPANIYNLLATI